MLKSQKYKISFAISAILLLISSLVFAAESTCKKYPANLTRGNGPLPYNYRVIDGHIHAGGHPLNPREFSNSREEALSILNYLKSQGVKNIIDLENTWNIQEKYSRLLKKAGIKRLHIPMHSYKTPAAGEWLDIKEAMKGNVYIHCKYGADRTGAIIAKYLIEEKNYPTMEAWEAVITGGSHAGPLGGLKKTWEYRNLILFICPDAEKYKEFKSYFED